MKALIVLKSLALVLALLVNINLLSLYGYIVSVQALMLITILTTLYLFTIYFLKAMSRKENIFFYDEQLYRFSLYYEDHDWWFRNGFNACKQCLQSNIISLIFQLLKLKPKYVIFLHRSNRVFFLASLANLLGIKVIFWQHGFFAYPAQRKFPIVFLIQKLTIYCIYLIMTKRS